jgi:hypothetical protein
MTGRTVSNGGFSVGLVLRRMRTALKKLHRAIAAAKIRRLRNELQLHAATRASWARPHQPPRKRTPTGFRANRCISAKMGFLTCDNQYPYRHPCCAH